MADVHRVAGGLTFIIRGRRQDDLNFILNSWKTVHRRTMPYEFEAYMDWAKKRIERVVFSGSTQWRLAANDQDPSQLLGWAARGRNVTHFVYVKDPFRRCGVARTLLADWPRVTDWWTWQAGRAVAESQSNERWVYHPGPNMKGKR